MAMRSKQVPRCIRCRMHAPYCICDAIPELELATRLVVVMHYRERSKATATAPLALQCLPNSELRIHGLRNQRLDMRDLSVRERRPLVLYPSRDATLLSRTMLEQDPRPVTLIVPDGSWRQASRMRRRLLPLETVQAVRLPFGTASQWGLRRETSVDRVSTFEAIARALGIIESKQVQDKLETVFRHMVNSVLQSKGRIRRTRSLS